MARMKTYSLGAGTLFCALAIGYVMQFGLGSPNSQTEVADRQLVVTNITPTSSAAIPPLPSDKTLVPDLPKTTVALSTVETVMPGVEALPQGDVAGGFDCTITMQADPIAGAMVRLALSAPCQGSERVTIHHHGLMFTQVTQPDGTLAAEVPALTESALFIASFGNGEGAVAQTQVTSLPFYDRVAVQWKGDSGLQLHAREFSAEYFSEGHVWNASAGDIARAARGEGGFLTSLGHDTSPEALRVEVYSYPAGTTSRSGQITLTVEAEVTAQNCGRDIEAQTFERPAGGTLRVRDLTMAMPDCDTTGDFLVLKNLIQDLTIAAN